MISVVIPVYNEAERIGNCLESLSKQDYPSFEIIIVDDGSRDNVEYKIKNLESRIGKKIKFISQEHSGPGEARNRGAQSASGDVLVFVDADMVFDKKFITKLIEPIKKGLAVGTFAKEEMLANSQNDLAVCYNLNRYIINGWKLDQQVYRRILPSDYPDTQPVFRAIRKCDFDKVRGFTPLGYTDDWTLSRKLGIQALNAPGAVFYHANPESFGEIYQQARWIGYNEFLTGNSFRKVLNLIRYSFIFSLVYGVVYGFVTGEIKYLPLRISYDFGVWVSVLSSFRKVQVKK